VLGALDTFEFREHGLLCDRAGQIGESGALRREGWEWVMAIPRFQGGSPRLCRLRTMSFLP
jgi:hypothetical protein